MSETALIEARQLVLSGLDDVRAASAGLSGQELIDHLVFVNGLERRVKHDVLSAVGRLDRQGEFVARGVYPSTGVADLLRRRPTGRGCIGPTSWRRKP